MVQGTAWSCISPKKYGEITWGQCLTLRRKLGIYSTWRLMRMSPGGYKYKAMNADGTMATVEIIFRPIDVYPPSLMWPLRRRVKFAMKESDVVYKGSFQIQIIAMNVGEQWPKTRIQPLYKRIFRHLRAHTVATRVIPADAVPIRNLEYQP